MIGVMTHRAAVAMPLLIEQERDSVRQRVVELGELVSVGLRCSLDALRRQDAWLAREIITGDGALKHERRFLEQRALMLLATHQPVGHDLRFVTASLAIVTELERIADHAADIAHLLLDAEETRFPEMLVARIAAFGEVTEDMLSGVMAVYARETDRDDGSCGLSAVGSIGLQEQATVQAAAAWLCGNADESAIGIELLHILHHYEQVASRATSIASRIRYIATGEVSSVL